MAKVIRSKNAGALLITMDIMFDKREFYEQVRDSNALTPKSLAPLYNASNNEVTVTPFDVAWAIKITLPRAIISGSLGDTDIYGAQQHTPLMDVDILIP